MGALPCRISTRTHFRRLKFPIQATNANIVHPLGTRPIIVKIFKLCSIVFENQIRSPQSPSYFPQRIRRIPTAYLQVSYLIALPGYVRYIHGGQWQFQKLLHSPRNERGPRGCMRPKLVGKSTKMATLCYVVQYRGNYSLSHSLSHPTQKNKPPHKYLRYLALCKPWISRVN